MNDILNELYKTVKARKKADPRSSYVAKLLGKGHAHIAKKLGEEAVETAIASAQNDRDEIIYESADLLFHLVVLLAAHDIKPKEVMDALEQRKGVSGIEEKAGRKH
jgi:phosphoribosyl-ATP pyrophosphohydrolase